VAAPSEITAVAASRERIRVSFMLRGGFWFWLMLLREPADFFS
jgi:hypothetical protein